WQQLSDDEKWAVLIHTGYMPLYRFSYDPSNSYKIENREGVLARTAYAPTWDQGTSTQWKVYALDIDGMRDKFVLMPEGANEDVLSITSRAVQTTYLHSDTVADGLSEGGLGGNFYADPTNESDNFATKDVITSQGYQDGEYVGDASASARIKFAQTVDQVNGFDAQYVASYYNNGKLNYEIGYGADLITAATATHDFTINTGSSAPIANMGNGSVTTGAELLDGVLGQTNYATSAGRFIMSGDANQNGAYALDPGLETYQLADLWSVYGSSAKGGVSVGSWSSPRVSEYVGLDISGRFDGHKYGGAKGTIDESGEFYRDDLVRYRTGTGRDGTSAGETMALKTTRNNYIIEFSKPVVNPILYVMSLGNGRTNGVLSLGKNENPQFLASSGDGDWGSGGLKLGWHSGSGNVTYGWDLSRKTREGNGLVVFEGVYKYIDFRYTTLENYGLIGLGVQDVLTPGSLKSRLVDGTAEMKALLETQTQSMDHYRTLDPIDLTFYSPDTLDDRQTEVWNWSQTPQKMYDQRDRIALKLTTQARDIFDKRPDYQTYIQERQVPIMRDVVVYNFEPIYKTETQLVQVQAGSEIRTVNGGAGDSLKGLNITVKTGASFDASGRITAFDGLIVETADDLTLKGQVPTGGTERLLVEVTGDQVSMNVGGSVVADTTVSIKAYTDSSTLAINAERDIAFDGVIEGATDGDKFTSIVMSADRNLTSEGVITGDVVAIKSGQNELSGFGDITITEPARITADQSLSFLAGGAKGDILLRGGVYTVLDAAGEMSFTALSGSVGSVAYTMPDSTVAVPSLAAHGLIVQAGKSVDLQHLDIDVLIDADLTQAGNIVIMDKDDLVVNSVRLTDGELNITAGGALTVSEAMALGTSDRNDISLMIAATGGGSGQVAPSETLTYGNITTGVTGSGGVLSLSKNDSTDLGFAEVNITNQV
ncbi:MAG: hypothetical protein ACPGJH_08685, partial [Alphaproteobacteria bacterium]